MRGAAARLLPAPLTHVLIHVEGLHVLEGQVPVLVVLHQLLVASQRRAACGRTDRQTVSQTDRHQSVSQSGSPSALPVGSPSVKQRPGPGAKCTMRLRMYLAAHSLACAYVSWMISFMAAPPLRRHLSARPASAGGAGRPGPGRGRPQQPQGSATRTGGSASRSSALGVFHRELLQGTSVLFRGSGCRPASLLSGSELPRRRADIELLFFTRVCAAPDGGGVPKRPFFAAPAPFNLCPSSLCSLGESKEVPYRNTKLLAVRQHFTFIMKNE